MLAMMAAASGAPDPVSMVYDNFAHAALWQASFGNSSSLCIAIHTLSELVCWRPDKTLPVLSQYGLLPFNKTDSTWS